jgi:hypothetical protein
MKCAVQIDLEQVKIKVLIRTFLKENPGLGDFLLNPTTFLKKLMSIINTLFQRAKELTTLLTHSMGQ